MLYLFALLLTSCLTPAGFDPNVFENKWWELEEYPVCFNFHESGFLTFEESIVNEGPWEFEDPNIYHVQEYEFEIFYREECWIIQGYLNINLTACECVILPGE